MSASLVDNAFPVCIFRWVWAKQRVYAGVHGSTQKDIILGALWHNGFVTKFQPVMRKRSMDFRDQDALTFEQQRLEKWHAISVLPKWTVGLRLDKVYWIPDDVSEVSQIPQWIQTMAATAET